MTDSSLPIRFFEPSEERLVVERRLPHWSQPGTVCFITWRTWDSLPKDVMERLLAERRAWLARIGIDPMADDWRAQLTGLPRAAQLDFHNRISERWESSLDACHGS